MPSPIKPKTLAIFAFLLPSWTLFAQSSLALSSSTAASGGSASLSLSLSAPAGTNVAALQWTLTYPTTVSNVSVTAGAALTAAVKTVTCASTTGGLKCVASGVNANTIANGVVATVSATVSGSASISVGVSGVLGATPDGSAISLAATGGTITLVSAVTISSLTCTPTSLSPGGATTCTVKLSGTGGANVTLGTTGSISTASGSLAIAAGSSSGTFTATAGQFTSDQSATVTASLSGSSSNATISLVAPVLVSNLLCQAVSLASNGSTTCTVTLTKAAPSGGAAVALTGGIAKIFSIPTSVTVPANATTATFTATTGSVTADQSATITATLNGSSQIVTISLSGPALVSALQCVAASLASNASTTCTVTLTKPAPAGGAVVSLSGGITNVFATPASVTVPANAATANFLVGTGSIPFSQNATITAGLNGSSRNWTLPLVGLVLVSSIQCNAASLVSNSNTTCTVTLSKPSLAGGAVLALSGAISNILTFPASATVSANTASTTFTVKTGSIKASQTVTIMALYGTSFATTSVTLISPFPTLSSLTCSPISVQPGGSGTCTVSLQGPITQDTWVPLRSSDPGLTVPVSINIVAKTPGASFAFTTTTNATGRITISALLGAVTKSVAISVGASTTTTMQLSCPKNVRPGAIVVCGLQLGSSSSNPMVLRLSSTSSNFRIPRQIAIRPGQYSARFEAIADPAAGPETVTLSAASETGATQSSLEIERAQSPVLDVTGNSMVQVESKSRLHVSAAASDGFPVSLAGSHLPAGSSFDPARGDLEWTPTKNDIGDHELTFTATDSVGVSSSRQAHIYVGAGGPELTGLRNFAPGATAACTPGSAATLTGRFLSASGQQTQVFVNGSGAQVLSASAERVDFLCPSGLAPGATLEITLQNGARRSSALKATMAADAPGILTVDDSATGQALAFRRGTSELVGVPNPQVVASPAFKGDLLSVLVSGVPCDETYSTGSPRLLIGAQAVSPQSVRPAENYAGVCEITAEVPAGVADDHLPLRLQMLHNDGTVTNSNAASITVEDR